MATTNTEVLERLLIEVVGDDSTLQQFLDDAVDAAKKAAASMRDSLNVDFSKISQGASETATAVEGMSANVGDLGKILETQLARGVTEFDKVREAGKKTEEQFEEYRRAILETIDSQRPLAQAVGVSASVLDDLAKQVREATYEQNEQAKAAERTAQEQEELAATMRRLSNEVRSSRNDWAGMRTETGQFEAETRKSKAELEQLITTVERGSDAYRKISQDIAYAQRGLDSASHTASRGGLAWTAQIAISNQFGQSLRNLGPAGNAAAAGLGFMESGLNRLIPRAKEGDSVLRMLGLTSLRFAAVWYPVASALIPLVGAGLIAKLSADAAKAARELENATYRTGLTVEGLQELQHAARSTGVPLDLLNTTMQRLQRRAADANAGNKGLQQAFRALGVTLTDENGKMRATEDLLGQVADGLNRVERDADRLALAFKVFDTEGGRLLPLLNEGSEGIRKLREEARELGLVVSGDTVMSLSQLDAEIKTVMQQFSVLRMEVAGSFLPVMQGALLPLVEQKLIPALQRAADDIADFADRFFDATEAGAAFREDTVKNLRAIITLGQGVVAAAQVVWGAVNTIIGMGASAYGAGQGLANWQENNERILARRRDLTEQILYMQAQLQEEWAAPGTQASIEIARNLAAAREELASLPTNWQEAIAQGAREAGGVMADNAVAGFTGALNTLQADVAAQLEALLAGTDFTRPARRAGQNAGEGFGDGFGDGTRQALEGSLKYAQEQLQKAQEELAYAVGSDARADQLAIVRLWEEAVALIQEELERFDPAKAAKLWVARLGAELKLGLKDASEVFDILNPRLEELREEAAAALVEFGIDSTQYQDVLAKLEEVEALVTSIKDEANAIDLSGLIRSVGGGFGLPETGADPTAGLLAGLQLIMRIEEQEAKLEGRALNVGEAFAWMLPILDEQLDLAERGTEAWFATAELIARIRGDLNAIDTTDLLRSVGGGLSIPDGSKSVTQALVEGFELIIRTEEALAGMRGEAAQLSDEYEWMVELLDEHAATLTRGSEEWLQTVEAANRYRALISNLPDFTGIGGFATPEQTKTATDGLIEGHAWLLKVAEAEDVLAGKNRDLAGTYSGMIDEMLLHINTLQHGSDAWLQAVGALEAYYAALERVMSGEEVAASGFAAWAEGVARIGVTIDPISAAFAGLGTLMASGKITTEEYALGVDTVFAAMNRLNQLEFDAGLGSWTDAVQRLGVASDPVRDAREQLEKLFAGKEDAEGYAAALELLAAAEERLAGIEAAAAAEKAAEAWRTASQQVSAFLRVNQVDLSDLRDAAEEAFEAGVIGADELADALDRIKVMEVVESLRLLGQELGGTQGIIPNLMGDLTQAFAQLSAGNITDAIATTFNAATAAVRGLGAAFEDTEHQAEAVLDLVIGAAAGIATAIGGPALGQAVGAIGNFVKSVLGDLSNGLAAIEKQINQTTTSSKYLGEGLVRGIAAGATQTVSRGGLLGLLGFTKQALDDDAFRAGVSVAEGLAQGMVNTLRSGDFEEAWQAFIDDIIINGIIEAFIATALVQDAIEEAMELIMGGETGKGAARLDELRNDFQQVWQTIQSITSTTLPDQDELERSVMFSLPDATVSVLAAPQWALDLSRATERMVGAGDAMLEAATTIQDTFSGGITVTTQSTRGIDANRSL